MQEKRVFFKHRMLPVILVAPQIMVTLVFFIWPATQALLQSMLIQDAFGLKTQFVWLDNFKHLFSDSQYLDSVVITFIFSTAVVLISMSLALLLALKADRLIRASKVHRTLLIWPYAVAPPLAGVLWLFMFNPTSGVLAYALQGLGYEWDHVIIGWQALLLVTLAASWRQISYNFLFFLAGLQAIPQSLIEASAIDGAGPRTRFRTIIFPLLSPTTFFLLVVNLIYAFFETFGIIHTVTQGGPARATETMIYKVFNDGFIGLDLGGSAAQSVVLMALVIGLTIIQFRFIERRVNY